MLFVVQGIFSLFDEIFPVPTCLHEIPNNVFYLKKFSLNFV